MTMTRTWTMTLGRLGAVGALALSVGCASIQKKTTGAGGGDDDLPREPGSSADALSVVAPTVKTPARNITADQRAEFERALAVYERLKKAGPLKGGECSEAASAFRRAADSTNLPEARHAEATVYFECGKKSDAIAIWEKLAGGPRPSALGIIGLGVVALQNGDAAKAETLFNRAVEADPLVNSVTARLNLATMLRDRARQTRSVGEKNTLNDQVLRHLRTVLALDGNNLEAYAKLCHFYYDIGLSEAAKLIALQATKKGEEIATGKIEDDTSTMGAATVDTGAAAKKGKDRGEDAAPRRRTVAVQGTGWTPEMKKHIAVVYNTLGLVALDKKSFVDATSNFRRAVEMDPALYEGRLNLAAVSLKFRNYKIAEENFRAVLAAHPKNYEAIIGLGVALRGNKQFDEAEQQYVNAQKVDPARPESYFNLGLLNQEYRGSEKETLQKAQGYYREFLQRGGNTSAKMRKDAERRIKDIDELFVAIEEAAKLQREAEELQKKADEQQKKADEEMKRQADAEKAPAAATAESKQPPAGGATPTNTLAPPPAK